MSPRVGVALSSDFSELDDGWPLLRASLVAAGFEPVLVVWDQDDPSAYELDLVLVNYCWGYVTRRSVFLAWAEKMAARSVLMNPFRALRWNSDKIFLVDLAAGGVPIVPTTFVRPGQPWSAPRDDYVVKPSVGSGGWWAARYSQSAPEVAERHIAMLHAAGQTVMVQPYQRAIDMTGETAVVFFGGEASHAVHKAALLEADVGPIDALWKREVITAVAAPEDHLEVAKLAMEAVLRCVGETAYARVDVIDGNDGSPLVLEVELVEPSLFLPTSEWASARLAHVVQELLRRAGEPTSGRWQARESAAGPGHFPHRNPAGFRDGM